MERCAQCGKTGDLTNQLRRCSRCKAVHYCSRDCQARNWSKHKATCKPPNEGAAEPTSGAEKPSTASSSTKETAAGSSPSSSSWQRARSRAGSEAFPGNRVIDDFRDLKPLALKDVQFAPPGSMVFPSTPRDPFSLTPSANPWREGVAKGVVVLVKLVSQIYHPFRPEWTVQDIKGDTNAVLRFRTAPEPHLFRSDDLQKGHFLCVKDPMVMLMKHTSSGQGDLDYTMITVMSAANVRAFVP